MARGALKHCELRPYRYRVVRGRSGFEQLQFSIRFCDLASPPKFGSKSFLVRLCFSPVLRIRIVVNRHVEIKGRVSSRDDVVVHVAILCANMTKRTCPCPLQERLGVDQTKFGLRNANGFGALVMRGIPSLGRTVARFTTDTFDDLWRSIVCEHVAIGIVTCQAVLPCLGLHDRTRLQNAKFREDFDGFRGVESPPRATVRVVLNKQRILGSSGYGCGGYGSERSAMAARCGATCGPSQRHCGVDQICYAPELVRGGNMFGVWCFNVGSIACLRELGCRCD